LTTGSSCILLGRRGSSFVSGCCLGFRPTALKHKIFTTSAGPSLPNKYFWQLRRGPLLSYDTRLKQYLRLAEQADSNAVEYEPFKIKDKVSIQVSAITRSVA
jgi:hypothetical protein